MILISGATGRVGSAAARALAEAGVPFRAFVRDAERFPIEPGERVEVVTGDLADPAALSAAMEGIDKAFLVTPNSPDQAAIERSFADTAAASGVAHLVKLSSIEATPDAKAILPRQHHESEEHIRSLGLSWTFLRPDFYLQNMLMFARAIAANGAFALPFGDAALAPVDTRDIGAVAARVLAEDGHENTSYDLTGPEPVTMHDIAQRMSAAIDRPIAYHPQTHAEFRAAMAPFIPSEWQLDAVCELFEEIAGGSLGHVSADLPRLLGRDPIGIEQFARDYAMAFGAQP